MIDGATAVGWTIGTIAGNVKVVRYGEYFQFFSKTPAGREK